MIKRSIHDKMEMGFILLFPVLLIIFIIGFVVAFASKELLIIFGSIFIFWFINFIIGHIYFKINDEEEL